VLGDHTGAWRFSPNRINCVVVIWLALLIIGCLLSINYDNLAGTAAINAPKSWPKDTCLPRNQNGYTLVVVAHPRCVCTRATISELAQIMTRLHGRAKTQVLFVRPEGFPLGWERTDTWYSAENIPGVAAICDLGGKEASRFGAATSGQLFIYDREGKLVFAGGITGSRGHEGDNVGLDEALSSMEDQQQNVRQTAVYGCPLTSTVEAKVCKK
jgi:hypothetical protein